ncbi:MAG: hypothetical protein LBK47_04080 [Prevotellaceae bacterium]|jgi:hypothetical protein|nr:hypothetical protein [Prevotellaceae bacterium]
MKRILDKLNNYKYYFYAILVIGVIFAIVTLVIYREDAMRSINEFLKSKTYFNAFKYSLTAITLLIYFIHYLLYRERTTLDAKDFVDRMSGGITYALITTNTLTLTKGIFMQFFFNEEPDKPYFRDWDNLDLVTLTLMIFVLFTFAITQIINVAKEIVKRKYSPFVNPARGIVKRENSPSALDANSTKSSPPSENCTPAP